MRRLGSPTSRHSYVVRLLSGIVVAIAIAITTLSAQIPGRNVNMVAGTKWPEGDPFLQRQNEPSIAASTRNPLHLFAGANDYRTVDLPGLAEDETGDAWLGVFKSWDGGQRWVSTLVPGYPQDTSALGVASPIHGYGASADPVVRAGTNGLIYYAGLVFDRANAATPDVTGKSAIFVARYIDNNNKEAGDTFEYLGTRVLQKDPGGVGGNFLDKPWLAVDIPRDNTRCTIVTQGSKGPITQSVPAGPLYVAYTLRSTDSLGNRYDVMFTRSADCGNTWSTPTRLNDPAERANQGASIAIDPRNGNVFIAWRQFDLTPNDTGTDALVVAKYNLPMRRIEAPHHGRKFDKPKKRKAPKQIDLRRFYRRGGINRALEANELSPLDQSTSSLQIRFRTNAYPTMAIDETGRIYMAWAERGFDPLNPDPVLGSARILMATSTDGRTWTPARAVSSENQKGHQLMPALTYAGGKLMLVYYDIRETRSQSFTQYIDDKSAFGNPQATGLRHTIDLRASMATPGATPAFTPSVKVSEYIEGPRVPKGPNVPWQVNPPNLPMFQKGTAPFIGDYVDVTAAPTMIMDATGKWVYNNTASATPPIFHAAWTDNRDVRIPLVDADGDGNPWNDYTPPGINGGASIFDPTKTVAQCVPGNAGSRNQNVYTSRITGGLLAGSPGNTKRLGQRLDASGAPLNELIERSFVVFAQNTGDTTKRFRFTITNQPVGGRASFDQFSAAPLTAIDADIPYRSTASRTLYATSTDPHAQINVAVQELTLVNNQYQVKTGGLATAVILNPDIDNPDIDNPDIDNPDIDNPDIDNAEVMNPDIDNPDIDNPDIDNPDIDNPDIDNPDIDNVTVANPDIDNPDIDNPDIDNPDIDNPDIDNPDIDNPDIDNASLMTDVTWTMKNTGNTTASYNVNLFFAQTTFDPAIKTQLILYRTYKTPVVRNCDLKTETRNVLVANIPDPQLVKSSTGGLVSPNDPSATNATIYLAPGESARITLRVFDPHPDPAKVVTVTNADGSTAKIVDSFVPHEDVTPVIQQQGVNTEDKIAGVIVPPPVVEFPPPQTVADSASTAENTPVRLNVLANDSTAFGSTKIVSFHPAGMAAHSGAVAGDIAYQPSTGFLYTQRGAVDPSSNALVGRFPSAAANASLFEQVSSPKLGLNYLRYTTPTTQQLAVLDARPDSPTFHQYLPMPVLTDSVLGFAIDAPHNRIYAVNGPQNPTAASTTTLSVIAVGTGAPTTHTVVGSVSLPLGLRTISMAVNTRTQRVYISTVQSGTSPGGVYMVDMTSPTPTPVRLGTFNSAWSLAVNEGANMVFALTGLGGSPSQAGLIAIDGATGAATSIALGVPLRTSSPSERLVVHEASGKVLVRLESQVVIVDGQRGSPTRNTVVAVLPVGRENGAADLAIDQELGIAVTIGSFDFRADVIDINSNTVTHTVPLTSFGQDVAIDQVHHRAFLTAFTSIVTVNLLPFSVSAPAPVFVESGSILLNPVKNKAYIGVFDTAPTVIKMSGAGFEGPLTGLTGHGRFLYSAWHNATNYGFITSQGDEDGTSSDPGTVLVIDGNTDTVLGSLDVPAGPFGIDVDQTANKLYVASLPTATAHGALTIGDISNLSNPPTQAAFTATASSPVYPAFPLPNSGTFMAFGRHVVVNPSNHKVYTMQVNTAVSTSAAVYDPGTNIMKPLDGIAGSPLFDAANPGPCGGVNPPCVSWGRVNVIRAYPSLNRIYLGLLDTNSGIGRIVAIDSATDAVVATWVGGSHSNRHTASFLAVNEAQNRIYVTDYTNNKVTMLDPDLVQIGPSTALPGGPSATAVNTVSNRLYVSAIDNKTIYAIDGSTLQLISSVRMPLVAYFMNVDAVESRVYASGGDSEDESGAMVITDVLGQLGTNVSVTSVGSATHGTTTLNADGSVFYTPAPGYSGPDSFSYNIAAPTGTAIGTVSINVVPSMPQITAFGDTYNATANQVLNVAAPGPMANDATGSGALTFVVDATPLHGTLSAQADGGFAYTPTPGYTGMDSFQYHVASASDGSTNTATVTITVVAPTVLVVTNTNDSGAGSLRQALTTANVEAGSTISFNIPGAGPFTIAPTTVLPTVTQPVSIDGYTQPGASANTLVTGGTNAVIKIQLRGNAIVGGNNTGLTLTGGNSLVRGLSIGNFSASGIILDTLGNDVVEGNFLGVAPDGVTATPNTNNGVVSQSANNLIGGSSPAARNLVSGNAQNGVRVTAKNTGTTVVNSGAGTTVTNNLIGTTRTGLAALANGTGGVIVLVPNVTVGGTTPALRNVIAGNNSTGVNAFALTTGSPQQLVAEPSGLIVQGNYIGVGADGLTRVANNGNGVFSSGAGAIIGGSTGTTPGGACTGACNVIAGNSIGINLGGSNDNTNQLQLSKASGSIVEGNFIGLGVDGTTVVNNTNVGVFVTAPGVRIGGTLAAQRNVIGGNSNTGINITASVYSSSTVVATDGAGAIISGNYVGLDTTGQVTKANNGGISVSVPNVRIGGATAGERNIVAGNANTGISGTPFLTGTPSTALRTPQNLIVQGNYVGVAADGVSARPNTGGGLNLTGANSTIGGTTGTSPTSCTGACNLISGNGGSGLVLTASFENTNPVNLGTVYASASNSLVRGNYIGTNAAGTAAVPNGSVGLVVNAPSVTVGGTTPGARNVISGNGNAGISLGVNFVTSTNLVVASGQGSVIANNYIGLTSDGSAKLTNAQAGINSVVPNVTIGGTTALEGNRLAVAANNAGVSLQRQLNGATPVSSATNTSIQNNTVGLSVSGTAINSLGSGIVVTTASNQIVGNTVAATGNAATPATGITLSGANATGNTVRGNYVGTTAASATGLGVYGTGIAIQDASSNTIGGTVLADRNYIAGNEFGGIQINANSASPNNNTILGNAIGVLPNGAAYANNNGGVQINAFGAIVASGNVIGGDAPGAGNVIGGNTGNGVALSGGVTNTAIRGNFIGVLADGVTARGNTAAGVWIANASDNTVGGVDATYGNIIANNGQAGVGIGAFSGPALRNRVLSNRTFNNVGPGIDLQAGANNSLAAPNLSNATNANPTTHVSVDLSHMAVGTYQVQFFSNTTCSGATADEGENFIFEKAITQPGDGDVDLGLVVPNGQYVSATATDSNGNTSRFSTCALVSNTLSMIVTNANNSGPGSLRQAIANANAQAGVDTITFSIPGAGGATPATITLASALPVLREAVVIDAMSQPGYDGKPVIEVDGQNLVANGFDSAPDVVGVTIKGLAITRFTNAGIFLMQHDTAPSGANTVQGNYLGTDRFGNAGKGNATGIVVRSDRANVTNNVASGNTDAGIRLEADADNVNVANNYIGVMADGTTLRGNGSDGIRLYDSLNDNIINNNVIAANGGWGVNIQDSLAGDVTHTQLFGNKIGLASNGLAVANVSGGVHVENGPSTEIGQPGNPVNVISGNNTVGILITPTLAGPMPSIRNNYIGLDATGVGGRPNSGPGIKLEGPALIGGTNVADRNYISANGQGDPFGAGIVFAPGADTATVLGNVIGLDVNGGPAGNTYAGILVRSSGMTNVGDGSPAGANVISANGSYGISMIKQVPTDNPSNLIVRRNFIGTDGSGTVARANGQSGIYIADSTGATIGGSGMGNVIKFNGGDGVRVGNNAISVNIRENFMEGNAGLGIDLGGDGVTTNDAADADLGANTLQNYPTMVSATQNGLQTDVAINTADLQNGVNFTVELFSSQSCDASGFGEGTNFLGSFVVTGGTGQVVLSAGAVPVGFGVSATATSSTNQTSEFSNCVAAVGSF